MVRRLGRRMAGDAISLSISYAHEDAGLARAIQERLEEEGFEVWIDEDALRAGDSLMQSIATAIHEMEFDSAESVTCAADRERRSDHRFLSQMVRRSSDSFPDPSRGRCGASRCQFS